MTEHEDVQGQALAVTGGASVAMYLALGLSAVTIIPLAVAVGILFIFGRLLLGNREVHVAESHADSADRSEVCNFAIHVLVACFLSCGGLQDGQICCQEAAYIQWFRDGRDCHAAALRTPYDLHQSMNECILVSDACAPLYMIRSAAE